MRSYHIGNPLRLVRPTWSVISEIPLDELFRKLDRQPLDFVDVGSNVSDLVTLLTELTVGSNKEFELQIIPSALVPADLLVKKLDGAIACCPTVERMRLSHVIFAVLLLQFLNLFIPAEETAIFAFHAKGQRLPMLVSDEVFAPLIELRVPVGSIENHPRVAIPKFPFDDVLGFLIDRQHKLFGYEFKIFIELTIIFVLRHTASS